MDRKQVGASSLEHLEMIQEMINPWETESILYDPY